MDIIQLKNKNNEHVDRDAMLDVIHDQIKPKRACEVGVQRGRYSNKILHNMPSLEQLYLVDLWRQQPNYADHANVPNRRHNRFYSETVNNVRHWEEKVIILRGYSTVMCDEIPDDSLDWVYIDARHDYKGVAEDIEKYWPKVKSGGIMSGHDYLTSEEVKQLTPDQDWSICYDGSIEPRAVKGAVDDFAASVNKDIFVTSDTWPSWSIYK